MRTRIFCPTGEVVPVGLFSCVSVENNAKNAFYLADDAATYGFYSFPGGFQHRLGYFYYFLRSPFDGLSYGGACHLAHYAADEAAYGGGAFTSLSSPVRMASATFFSPEKPSVSGRASAIFQPFRQPFFLAVALIAVIIQRGKVLVPDIHALANIV